MFCISRCNIPKQPNCKTNANVCVAVLYEHCRIRVMDFYWRDAHLYNLATPVSVRLNASGAGPLRMRRMAIERSNGGGCNCRSSCNNTHRQRNDDSTPIVLPSHFFVMQFNSELHQFVRDVASQHRFGHFAIIVADRLLCVSCDQRNVGGLARIFIDTKELRMLFRQSDPRSGSVVWRAFQFSRQPLFCTPCSWRERENLNQCQHILQSPSFRVWILHARRLPRSSTVQYFAEE